MPRRKTSERSGSTRRKAPTSRAGKYVREEVRKVRRGEHGVRSPQQAVAIGLSKARRSGVDLPPPEEGKAKPRTRRSAKRDYEVGQKKRTPTRRPKASRAVKSALKREPKSTASPRAMSQQARQAASKRTPTERSQAARKAARTKGAAVRTEAARKAARTKGAAGRSAAARKGARTRAQRTGSSRAVGSRSTSRRTTSAGRGGTRSRAASRR